MNLTGLKLLLTQTASVLAETTRRIWPMTVVSRPANVPIVRKRQCVCNAAGHRHMTTLHWHVLFVLA